LDTRLGLYACSMPAVKQNNNPITEYVVAWRSAADNLLRLGIVASKSYIYIMVVVKYFHFRSFGFRLAFSRVALNKLTCPRACV